MTSERIEEALLLIPQIESSGALTETEVLLLSHMPNKQAVVLGGNYKGISEYWGNSPLKDLLDDGIPGEDAGNG